ncbi:MAG: hypothetical protein RXR20_00295 [Paraburkholderia sp.]|jgi:hypothetical protein|uniref:hypothetical protein n=1 Tax=Burkholderiaceae TaxID=119060 RepID=UPI0010F6A017|nr:hypothetical protein [Burkholderia sp. 4M9327F10]
MTTATGSAYAMQTSTPASLRELANYLEQALDAGQAVVVMRYGEKHRSVYIGDPADSLDTLSSSEALAAHLADEMLALTAVGMNRITADGQIYRFTRTHRYIEDQQAVIFAPA